MKAGFIEIKNLLKEAYDLMDDANAAITEEQVPCLWCNAKKYYALGGIHDSDCILVRMRAIEGIG